MCVIRFSIGPVFVTYACTMKPTMATIASRPAYTQFPGSVCYPRNSILLSVHGGTHLQKSFTVSPNFHLMVGVCTSQHCLQQILVFDRHLDLLLTQSRTQVILQGLPLSTIQVRLCSGKNLKCVWILFHSQTTFQVLWNMATM